MCMWRVLRLICRYNCRSTEQHFRETTKLQLHSPSKPPAHSVLILVHVRPIVEWVHSVGMIAA